MLLQYLYSLLAKHHLGFLNRFRLPYLKCLGSDMFKNSEFENFRKVIMVHMAYILFLTGPSGMAHGNLTISLQRNISRNTRYIKEMTKLLQCQSGFCHQTSSEKYFGFSSFLGFRTGIGIVTCRMGLLLSDPFWMACSHFIWVC